MSCPRRAAGRPHPSAASRGRILALGVTVGLSLLGNGPCGPLPGGRLDGEVVDQAVHDWSFVDDYRHCQLEVRPEKPHSVTTYCFAAGDVLYVPAIMGDGKQWTKMAIAEPQARIRVGGRIYPVLLERVLDPAELRAAAEAGYRRQNDGEDPPPKFEQKADRWYFRVTSR